mgnify:CR=1 FL=1
MYASPWAAPCTDGHRSRRYTSTAAIRCTIRTPRFRGQEEEPQAEKRPPFLRRVVKYFEGSTTDRTFEKKIDFTFAGGPSYSKNTSLGIGLLAAGLYRIDRTDSVTAPSDISIFANVSISGFYALGVTGNNIFARNSKRIDYTVMFASAPRDMWGIGYHDGRYNEEGSYNEKRYLVKGRYLHRVLPNTYVGGILSFEHTQGKKFKPLGGPDGGNGGEGGNVVLRASQRLLSLYDFRLKRLKHAVETDSRGLVLDRIQLETRRIAFGPSDQSEKAMWQFLEVAVEERIAFHGWALFD